MKMERVVQTMEELGSEVLIRDIQVGEGKYDLRIHNGSANPAFYFERGGRSHFTIQIIDGMLRMSREYIRPSHDHDDLQYLKTDKNGKLSWSKGMSHFWPVPSPEQILEIPFGAVSE